MDCVEQLFWVCILTGEIPVGLLVFYLYDWQLDPWLEKREEARKRKVEREKERKASKKAQPQLQTETRFNLDDIES